MSKPKALMTRPDIPKEGIEMMKAKFDVEIFDREEPIPREDLLKLIPGKTVLYCLLTDTIDKDVIAAAGSELKAIATMSVGYNHIDLNECKSRNICVSNTPGVSTDSVAEWTVTLLLGAGRHIIHSASAIANGEWIYSWGPVWLCGQGLKGATVGIYGMGQIGQAVMKRVLAFGVEKVLYHDVFHPIKPAEDLGAQYVELEHLVKNSDFIVTMCNLSDETRGFFCKRIFDMMKPNAVFVNTSRGEVVNQDDLYDALKNKKIRAAALDVTIPEPLPKDHKLLTLPNLIITPHVGSAEMNVRVEMAKLAAENLINVIEGKAMKTPVPMPK